MVCFTFNYSRAPSQQEDYGDTDVDLMGANKKQQECLLPDMYNRNLRPSSRSGYNERLVRKHKLYENMLNYSYNTMRRPNLDATITAMIFTLQCR